MSRRTVNAVICFTDADADPDPMSTIHNVSTHGYKSPDPPYYYAPPRLRGSVTFEKSIGTLFWGRTSNVTFGNIDIDVEDGGLDYLGGGASSGGGEGVQWVKWAQNTLNPQCLICIENADRTLLHLATADVEEISFPQDGTIRCRLASKFSRKLDTFVNDYVPATSDYDAEVQGQPVPTSLGAGAPSPPGWDPNTFDPRTHVKTLQVDPTSLRYMVAPLDADWQSVSPTAYYVMDRGVTLREGASPGFTLWENGFQLTSNPDGEITFIWLAEEGGGWTDPVDSSGTLKGVYRISRWAVWRAGIDISVHFPAESDFPDLYPVNITEDAAPFLAYSSEVSARTVLDDAVLNLCGYWYVDEFGDFKFGKLVGPETVSDFDFEYTDREMVGNIRVRVDRAPGMSTLMQYSYSPGVINENNLAGSLTSQGRRQRLSREWLQMEVDETMATVPDAYESARGAEPMQFYSGGLFTNRLRDELERRWNEYYSGIRRFYEWTIPMRGSEILPDLGAIGVINSEKAELLAYGELPLVLTKIKYDLGKGLIIMEGWGGETAPAPVPPPAPPIFQEIIEGPSVGGAYLLQACTPSAPVDSTFFLTEFEGIPGPAINVQATAVSDEEIEVTWESPDAVEIYRSESQFTGYALVGTAGASATSYDDTGLSASTAYFYYVIATNANGSSSRSNKASATTGQALPVTAGLASWLDAGVTSAMTDETNTPAVFADGDYFSRWQEDLAASPVAARWQGPTPPLGSTNGMQYVADRGGYPAVRVRGTTDTPISQDSGGSAVRCVTQDEVTLFAVMSSTAAAHSFRTMVYTAASFSGGTSGGYIAYQDRSPSGNVSQAFAPIYGGPSFTTSQMDTSDLRICAVRGTGDGGTAQGWIDGTSLGTAAQGSPRTYYQAFGGSALFQTSGSNDDYYIHEVLVYDRALTDVEVGQVNDYLKDKYGIT